MKSTVSIALILLAFTVSTAEAQQAKPVKGTSLIVPKPEGFTDADRFQGYQQEETGSSVMILEIPGPYSEVIKGFVPERMITQGMRLLSKEPAQFGQYKGILVSISQSLYDIEFQKWGAIFGDEKKTYMVMASYQKIMAPKLSPLLKRTVLAARESGQKANPLDALVFELTPVGEMKLAKVIGPAMILSRQGIFPDPTGQVPVMIVAPSFELPIEVRNRKLYAQARMKKFPDITDIVIKLNEEIAINGLDGYEIIATGKKSDAEVAVYQVMLFDTKGYYLIYGSIVRDQVKTMLPVFRQTARSFKLKQ